MKKIKAGPVVVMDGDEMAQVIWDLVRDVLILPYVDSEFITYDLSMVNRGKTDDQVTVDAATAIKVHRVGIKCATITPNSDRVKEFNLKKMYKSPNGTIRNMLGGTIFRAPVVCAGIPRFVGAWKKPIVVSRHAFGDQYKATEVNLKPGDKVKLVVEGSDGCRDVDLGEFSSPGVMMVMHNFRNSVEDFARSCFNYALDSKLPVFLSTKNTILQTYDGMFVDVFNEIFSREYGEVFSEVGLTYAHRLIDDMVSYSVKSEGGFLWACKNYDGDVQSDFVAQGFGSLGMMTSVLMSENGKVVETEAAHGTVSRHYKLYLEGKNTSTNSVASIFAWTKGLFYRAKFDGNDELMGFCDALERATVETIESGIVTKDLAMLCGHDDWVNTEQFVLAVQNKLALS